MNFKIRSMKALAVVCTVAGIASIVASFFYAGEPAHFLILAGLVFLSRSDTLLILAGMGGWKRL